MSRAPRRGNGLLAVVVVAIVLAAGVALAQPGALSGLPGPGLDGTPRMPGVTPEAGSFGSDRATVLRVVDGDTIVARVGTGEIRVRMLNIDAPESVKPDSPVECLGPEASAATKKLLPRGTKVTLEYDVERVDQYGRTLAAVVLADGRNVSVELARRGLATSVYFAPNRRFLSEVEAAEDGAREASVGLWNPATC